jgi:hypothetical protein
MINIFVNRQINTLKRTHPIGFSGFTEMDKPNFTGSYYSHTKAMVEDLLKQFPNVLTLRIRMPIIADLN